MPKVESSEAFKELVLNLYNELPQQQQLVAEYLLENLDEMPFSTVPTLSKACNVSEATIVRFAQRIGYDGFSQMKAELIRAIRGRVASKGSDGDDGPDPEATDNLSLTIRQETANLEHLGRDIDLKMFETAAKVLFNANHIYTFGLGISANMAELAGYLFTQIGLPTTPLSTKFSSPIEQVVVLRPEDALLVFSFPPFSVQTITLLKEAKERGVATLAVSDRLTAPVMTHSDYGFQVRTNNRMFTNAVGAVACFLNAISTEIAVKHGKQAVKAVSKINRILAQDPNLLSSC